MSKKNAKWEDEVRIAKEGVEAGTAIPWGACKCKENELLVRFLKYEHPIHTAVKDTSTGRQYYACYLRSSLSVPKACGNNSAGQPGIHTV